jgi:hypothetical protein
MAVSEQYLRCLYSHSLFIPEGVAPFGDKTWVVCMIKIRQLIFWTWRQPSLKYINYDVKFHIINSRACPWSFTRVIVTLSPDDVSEHSACSSTVATATFQLYVFVYCMLWKRVNMGWLTIQGKLSLTAQLHSAISACTNIVIKVDMVFAMTFQGSIKTILYSKQYNIGN